MLLVNAVNTEGRPLEIFVKDGRIAAVGQELEALAGENETVIDAGGLTVLPAFVDLHCHWRTPGFEYKEDIAPALLEWFYKNQRILPFRTDPSPYHVWLSEIMLQQTRVSAALPYYERFLAALPDIPALAACEEEKLHKLWEGLGYYNRARKAQACAQEVAARGGVWPDTVEGLLALLASLMAPLLTDAVLAEITFTGSLLIIGIGLNILGLTKLRILNMMPAVLFPILLCRFL